MSEQRSSSSSHRKHDRHERSSQRDKEDGADHHSSSKRHRTEQRHKSDRHHTSYASASRHDRSKHRSDSKRDHGAGQPEEVDEWVEKDANTSSTPHSTNSLQPISDMSSTSTALPFGSSAPIDTVGTFTPGEMSLRGGEKLQPLNNSIMTDGFGEGDVGSSSNSGAGAFGLLEGGPGGDDDLFSSMGIERRRKEPTRKVDPSELMGQSSRELNKAHWQGVTVAGTPSSTAPASGSPAPGSSGSAWRMSKLKRVYETAEEEGRDVEEVAAERYDSLLAFNEARDEKRFLDEREERRRGRRSEASSTGTRTPQTNDAQRKFVFTDTADPIASRPSSRASFRKPGEAKESVKHPNLNRTNSALSEKSLPSTPVPRVFTPPAALTPRPSMRPSQLSQANVVHATLDPDPTSTNSNAQPILSPTELNKLQAKVLKAKLMSDPKAGQLEAEYENERSRAAEASGIHVENSGENSVEMLPTLDGSGRLYDLGTGNEPVTDRSNSKRKKVQNFVSHDAKTGEVLRQNPDDDSMSLAELVRQERFSAGANDLKNMGAEIASRIAGDSRYANNLDYADENADKLASKKMKSQIMKKAFAVQDYQKTKKALDSCTMCFGDQGEAPRSAVVALGTRAFLGLLDFEELVFGHCRIVPLGHQFSSLDADDETWEEIKNFMKTLMQSFAERDCGVVFFESCINLKAQRHSAIEAIPVPFEIFDQLPAFFKEAIDNSEQEWSQHKKRIDFSAARPFRRSLVPNLPYFMVQFDYRGEKGFGHIIEGIDDAPDRDVDGEELRGELGEQGGGQFPRWFAQEIVGSQLELEPRKWRKPKKIDPRRNSERVKEFRKMYDKFDWTKMLKQDEDKQNA